jgi:Protein of unknown function (DUF4019)
MEAAMTIRRFLACGSLVWLLAAPAVAADEPEVLAQAAGESWLKLVDDGQYALAWERGAQMLRDELTQAAFVEMTDKFRKETGKLVSRKFRSSKLGTQSPSGAPGRYVFIEYDSVFEKRASAVETVIAVAESDATWRVAGAFIR